jgi:excisionase family DNA binding protein
MPPEPVPLKPLAVTVSTACELTSIGRTAMYTLIKNKCVASIKLGTRRLIVFSSLEALLQGENGSPVGDQTQAISDVSRVAPFDPPLTPSRRKNR